MHSDGKRKRRPRVDPYKLDLENLTGNENVSVINRETGKKITGAKAPPLRFLKLWLEQNPGFDVDVKWAHVVKAKVRNHTHNVSINTCLYKCNNVLCSKH